MERTPTVEDLFKKHSHLYQFEEGDPEYLVDEESFKESLIEFDKRHEGSDRFTLDEVSIMFYDVIRGITEGTLRRWNPTDFAKYIRSLQQKINKQ